MSKPNPPAPEPGLPSTPSAAWIVGRLALVLVAVGGLGARLYWQPAAKAPAPAPVASTVAAPAPPVVVVAPPAKKPRVKPGPLVGPPRPVYLEPDKAKIAAAEALLDAVTRERAMAEARAVDTETDLVRATNRARQAERTFLARGDRTAELQERLTLASQRGGFLKSERDQIKSELATLANIPRPKGKTLIAKNPVSLPVDTTEVHFELRRDRIAHLDLDRLIDLVKADAKLRLRLHGSPKPINSVVGPVGPFALRYQMGPDMDTSINSMLENRGVTFLLQGWEVVPEGDVRGETYPTTRHPASGYARVISRHSPEAAVITMWVYPDSFQLYRTLRDELQAHGFMVAARPLPEGLAIRGSPSGSVSAGQ
ncbi:hypothetical protein EP7_004975 [Isosphaeraceae bacterium EP7]